MGVLRYVYTSDEQKYQNMYIFLFFRPLYDEISNFSILRELYIILNWPTFENNQKTHLSISV